jgi:tetratricopeptide (TPR) repeat protein
MNATEPPSTAAPPPGPRRKWVRRVVGAAVLLALGGLACEGWALWHERAARRALADEDFDGARRHVARALEIHARRGPTNLLAARIERARGDYASAERYLVRDKELDGVTEALQMEWMLLRCERGEVDELAPALLDAVARDHPAAVDILESMARVYMTQTRYLEALGVLNKWIDRAPDAPRALDWRGWVNNQLDHRGQAIDDYLRALELRPARASVRLRLAQILVESSRYTEALPHLERLRAEGHPDPDGAVALAACRVVQGRTDEARQLLDAVLATTPDHFAALRQRGNLERDAGQYAESERWLRKALEQKPLDPLARYSLHLTLLAQPDRQAEAESERLRWEQDRQVTVRLTRLIRTELLAHPNDPDLAAEAGELLLRLGEERRGLYWLNKALSIAPAHPAAHRTLGAYYERTNDPVRAESHRRFVSAGNQQK